MSGDLILGAVTLKKSEAITQDAAIFYKGIYGYGYGSFVG